MKEINNDTKHEDEVWVNPHNVLLKYALHIILNL